jgi:hypothetical protein
VRRTETWSLADVLDFEWLLARDRTLPEAEVQNRDYAIRRQIGARAADIDRGATRPAPRFPAPTSIPDGTPSSPSLA